MNNKQSNSHGYKSFVFQGDKKVACLLKILLENVRACPFMRLSDVVRIARPYRTNPAQPPFVRCVAPHDVPMPIPLHGLLPAHRPSARFSAPARYSSARFRPWPVPVCRSSGPSVTRRLRPHSPKFEKKTCKKCRFPQKADERLLNVNTKIVG